MKLNIISPTKKEIFDIKWLDIQTTIGNFVIQQDHAPMILILKKNSKLIFFSTDDKKINLQIEKGLAHITRADITLLLN